MENTKEKTEARVSSMFLELCPHCRTDKVFELSKGIFEMPKMKVNCSTCGYKFDREPGYFLGAMYISYALAVMVSVLIFIVFHFGFPNLPLVYTPLAITMGVVLSAKKNYKLSRIIYIHIFPW